MIIDKRSDLIENTKMYTNKVIAFIDILGFKKIVDESTSPNDQIRDRARSKISYTFRNSENCFNDLDQFSEEFYVSVKYKYSRLSDSIIISADATNEGLNCLAFDILKFQLSCAGNGVYMKGGIAAGEVFHEDNVVYGPALITAYNLEFKRSLYPRIILNDNAFELAFENTKSILTQDADGYFFIDYINKSDVLETNEDEAELIYNYKRAIEYFIGEHRGTAEEFRYNWIENQMLIK